MGEGDTSPRDSPWDGQKTAAAAIRDRWSRETKSARTRTAPYTQGPPLLSRTHRERMELVGHSLPLRPISYVLRTISLSLCSMCVCTLVSSGPPIITSFIAKVSRERHYYYRDVLDHSSRHLISIIAATTTTRPCLPPCLSLSLSLDLSPYSIQSRAMLTHR